MNLESHYFCELCSEILVDPVFHQCCSNQYDDEKLFCRDCLEIITNSTTRESGGTLQTDAKTVRLRFQTMRRTGKSGAHGVWTARW